jgi:hypothetical protein
VIQNVQKIVKRRYKRVRSGAIESFTDKGDRMSVKNIMLVICIALFLCCSNDQVTEPPVGLAGDYTSIEFTAPGFGSGVVNIQTAGGYVKLSLTGENRFIEIISIPPGIKTGISSGIYAGIYSFNNNTLTISSPIQEFSRMTWDERNNLLEAPILSHIGSGLLILKKNNSCRDEAAGGSSK